MSFRRIAAGLEWIGIAGVLLMLFLTSVDVIGSKVFNKPLPGSFDWIGYLQVVAVGGAVAVGFYANRHIAFEFLVLHLPAPAKKAVVCFISLLCLVFFVILSWESVLYGFSLRRAGEMSSTAHLPLYPFAFFLALVFFVTSLFFIEQFLPGKQMPGGERGAENDAS
jgi:TRAP-type C4-dicarboxylate transport system permease small subunit